MQRSPMPTASRLARRRLVTTRRDGTGNTTPMQLAGAWWGRSASSGQSSRPLQPPMALPRAASARVYSESATRLLALARRRANASKSSRSRSQSQSVLHEPSGSLSLAPWSRAVRRSCRPIYASFGECGARTWTRREPTAIAAVRVLSRSRRESTELEGRTSTQRSSHHRMYACNHSSAQIPCQILRLLQVNLHKDVWSGLLPGPCETRSPRPDAQRLPHTGFLVRCRWTRACNRLPCKTLI